MRLEENGTVVLSERNLLSLLTKLHTTGSACTIVGGSSCPGLFVRAEPDEEHYAGRARGPGKMHPVTERIVQAVREATRGASVQ